MQLQATKRQATCDFSECSCRSSNARPQPSHHMLAAQHCANNVPTNCKPPSTAPPAFLANASCQTLHYHCFQQMQAVKNCAAIVSNDMRESVKVLHSVDFSRIEDVMGFGGGNNETEKEEAPTKAGSARTLAGEEGDAPRIGTGHRPATARNFQAWISVRKRHGGGIHRVCVPEANV